MIESLNELEESAKEEIKRADHLIFVTLKYTRTVDVIKNTIKRLISAYDFSILEFLEFLKKKKKIKNVPSLPKLRAEALRDMLPELKEDMEFYALLKRIDIAEYKKKEEYRKNVALIAEERPGVKLEVNMETLREYFNRTIKFVSFVEETVRS